MCQDEPNEGPSTQNATLPPPEVLAHLVDVHCHPTDSPIDPQVMSSLPIRICAMATRETDQPLVRDIATQYPHKVVPCFGYHPWFSHWIALTKPTSREEHYRSLFLSDNASTKPASREAFDSLLQHLPEPILLSDVLNSLCSDLLAFPNAMLGEVGLDRACRVPYGPPAPPPYVLHDNRRDLSPFTIPLSHQIAILEAQFDLAIELKRNVSFHSVKAQQATVELLDRLKTKHGDKWYEISVDMHSCGLSAQTWKDIEKKHSNVFLSLSTVINSRSPAHKDLIRTCAPNRILAESDYNDAAYLTPQTCAMLSVIADIKGWPIETAWADDLPEEKWGAVRHLEENWKIFQRGSHPPVRKKERRKLLLEDWESDEESRA